MDHRDDLTIMSDDSGASDEKMSPSDKADHEVICRDYLRNVCTRGKRCKFRHPGINEAKELGRKMEYTFCHDYQNAGCRRHNCKFIHCTREEEDYYKQSGQLPVRIQQAAALGIGMLPNELQLPKGEVPICKDYLKGECKRAGRCKYRHLTAAEYEYELRKNEKRAKGEVTMSDRYDTYLPNGLDKIMEYDKYDYDISLKRKRLSFEDFETVVFANGYKKLSTPMTTTDFRLIEEENVLLRRKIEELKKQVSDLTATNEVLLEQNARYRASKTNGLTTLTLSPPIVTVSQVVTPTVTPAPAVARAPPGVAHLASTVPLTLNASATELVVSALQSQTRMDEADMAPRGAMPPPAAALNPQGSVSIPTNIVPVSLPTCPVSLPVEPISVSSLPQPAVQATRVSLPAQTSMQQSMISAHTTPMVSYPIVSCPRLPSNSMTH